MLVGRSDAYSYFIIEIVVLTPVFYYNSILQGHKFTVNTTNILLMAIVVVLICLLLEGSEKPKKVVVVDKNKKSE